jgi:glutamate carboxypeptidase
VTLPSTGWMLEALETLVSCESPSREEDATRACGQVLTGLTVDLLDSRPTVLQSGGRTHLQFDWGTPTVLVLGHLDTVWPTGTLARWPFSVNGDVATGPGVFDMKAGVVQALAALSTLGSLDGIRLLLTSDEELGSPTSRQIVLDAAKGCRATLVCEPSAAGALKVARKGIALYDVSITGRAAHAGLEPEKGANAGIALAHAVLALAELGRPDLGTTVTPTLMSAGTTSNTVPAHGSVALDVRASVPAELDRVDADLRALTTRVAGTSLTVTGGVNRPPLDAASSADLFARATRLADGLGIPALQGIAVGGGSDGNFTAGAGVPTLDGLGAVGDGAHAEGEHILVSQMEPRARLLAALLEELR